MSTPFDVRWTTRDDLKDILRIEKLSFDTCAWNEDEFLRCYRTISNIGMSAKCDGLIVGFMIYELESPHKINLLKFAVDPVWRGRGVGRSMLAMLHRKLSQHRRDTITLDVRESNLPAQLFFRSQGFRAAAILPGFYTDGADAYRMRYSLTPAEPEPGGVIVRDYGGS